MLEEKDLTGESLIAFIDRLIENKPVLQKMAQQAKKLAIPDANERIYRVLMELYTEA